MCGVGVVASQIPVRVLKPNAWAMFREKLERTLLLFKEGSERPD